jgi:hypothetical protein
MTIEVTETRCCSLCQKFTSGDPEKFEKWLSINEKTHKDSTDSRNYYMCEICQHLINLCIEKYLMTRKNKT